MLSDYEGSELINQCIHKLMDSWEVVEIKEVGHCWKKKTLAFMPLKAQFCPQPLLLDLSASYYHKVSSFAPLGVSP
jgi:hypothetical protein